MKKSVTAILIFFFAAGAMAADSPTGRNPKLIWTPARQDVWNKMVAENNVWWKRFLDRIGRQHQDEILEIGVIAYQMTGDKQYAQMAWDRLAPIIGDPSKSTSDVNTVMDNFEMWVIDYDWLYPWLVEKGHDAEFRSFLNFIAEKVLNPYGPGNGTRMSDSDLAISHYFGLALLDLATDSHYLSRTFKDGDAVERPVGGLKSTGADFKSMRNAMSFYADRAAGGTFIESCVYNIETLRYVFLGIEGIRTGLAAKGDTTDCFPEYTALLPKLAMTQIMEMTPDIKDQFAWGDKDHDMWWIYRQTTNGMLAGLLKGTLEGSFLRRAVDDIANLPTGDAYCSCPAPRFYVLFDPFAPSADWRTSRSALSHFSSGMGTLYFHSGWGVNDAFFAGQMATHTRVDHNISSFGNFNLWRKGAWVLTNPKGFETETFSGGFGNHVVSANGMIIAGFSNANEISGTTNEEVGSDNSYAYMAGSAGGKCAPAWEKPREFMHEYTRSMLFLPGNGGTETLIIYDRVDAYKPNPDDFPYSYDADVIRKAPALKQWLLHTEVKPVPGNGGSYSWASHGQQLRLTPLLPENDTAIFYDETTLGMWGYWYNNAISQLRWQIRISPKVEQDWDTFLNVIRVGDSQISATESKLASSSGAKVEGVVVNAAPVNDVVALFSAEPGTRVPENTSNPFVPDPQHAQKVAARRVLKTGFSVDWTAMSAASRVFVFDLDRAKAWEASVDKAEYKPLIVSANDVAQLSATGAGQHTLTVRSPGPAGVRPADWKDAGRQAFVNDADVQEVTIFDLAGRKVLSKRLTEFPAGAAAGRSCRDGLLTGKNASGIYYAVVRGKKGGDAVRKRLLFAVAR